MSKTTEIPAKDSQENQRQAVAEVAVRTGVSSDYIRKVIQGVRTNEKVLRAYHQLLKQRAKAQVEFYTAKKSY
jgi:hypothetical protein